MSWVHEPWTQDDDVLNGLPYTVEPPSDYDITNVKTVWKWSFSVLGGLPYTVAIPAMSDDISRLFTGDVQVKAVCLGDTQVSAVYLGETAVWIKGV